MDRSRNRIAALSLALALAWPGLAFAQDELGDPEGGATEASDVEMGMGGSASYSSSAGGSSDFSSSGSGGGGGGGGGGDFGDSGGGGGGGLRLALQFRLDAIDLVAAADPIQAGLGRNMVPLVTPGVRILDNKLFLGLGLGFAAFSADNMGAETSRSGFSLSPLASYDLIDGSAGALALVGWFNYVSLGSTENCAPNGMCMEQNDDRSGVGLNLGVQIRGKLNESLAIGSEWGWGFLSTSQGGTDTFTHGIFGTLLFEGSVGL